MRLVMAHAPRTPVAPARPRRAGRSYLSRWSEAARRSRRATSFSGRRPGEAADLLHAMTADPDCYVVCTLSGAMTVAKMGLVICRMIEHGMVDCLISTGALMAHGLSEAVGLTHYKTPSGV